MKIQTIDAVWFVVSGVLLIWSVRLINRRYLKSEQFADVRSALRGFGTIMFIGGLAGHWMAFSDLVRPDRFWVAMIVNMPNLFTFSLWAGVVFGLGIKNIYSGRGS